VFNGLFHFFLALERALDHPTDRLGCGGRHTLADPLEGDEVSGDLIFDAGKRTRPVFDRDIICQTQESVESILVPTKGLFEVSDSTQGHQLFGFPQSLVGEFEQQRRIACATQRKGDPGPLDPSLETVQRVPRQGISGGERGSRRDAQEPTGHQDRDQRKGGPPDPAPRSRAPSSQLGA
jgi:hypothetical protein